MYEIISGKENVKCYKFLCFGDEILCHLHIMYVFIFSQVRVT